jgi:hypothetical protein
MLLSHHFSGILDLFIHGPSLPQIKWVAMSGEGGDSPGG